SNVIYKASTTINIIGNVILSSHLYDGGAIYAEGSDIDFQTWTGALTLNIESNEARYGGAIYIVGGSGGGKLNFSAENTNIKNNKARLGGAVYGENGALLSFSSITNLSISGNEALDGRGGIIYAKDYGTLIQFYDMGAVFTGNKAQEKGESIYLENRAIIDIERSTLTFLSNKASSGSALYIDRGEFKVSRSSLVFAKNSSVYKGAVYIEMGTMSVVGSSIYFLGNSAQAGSGLYLFSGYAEFDGYEVRFTSNVADSSGAAIFADSNSTVVFRTRLVDFSYNSSMNGRGILYWNNAAVEFSTNIYRITAVKNSASNGGFLYLSDKDFVIKSTIADIIGNQASVDGGALYLTNAQIDFEVLSTVTFEGNKAGRNGGAVYLDNSTGIFRGTTINFTSNVAVDGGAIYAKGGSDIIFLNENIYFEWNTSINGNGVIRWEDSVLNFSNMQKMAAYKNQALNGGFLYLNDKTLVFNTNILIASNTASSSALVSDAGDGGGLYLKNASGIDFTDASTIVFAGNIAARAGGAIYLTNSEGTFAGWDINFFGNTAETAGGAIYAVSGSSITFSNTRTIFDNNETMSGNGVVFWEDSNVIFANVVFLRALNNRAVNGGFLYLNNRTMRFETNTYIASNTAKAGNGGAIYLSNAEMTVNRDRLGERIEFSSNVAKSSVGRFGIGNGGAVYADRSNMSVFGTTVVFYGNIAESAGSAIYGIDSRILIESEYTFFRLNKSSGNGTIYIERSFLDIGRDRPLQELEITSNTAGNGGFLYIKEGGFNYKISAGIINMSSNTAVGNMSGSGDGGVLYLENSSITFEGKGVEWEYNRALSSGGALYMTASKSEMSETSSVFRGNRSQYGGGAIYAGNGSIISFRNKGILFDKNISENGDGIIYWKNSVLSFGNGVELLTASSNTANNGGFLYIDGAIFNYDTKSIFTFNSARGAEVNGIRENGSGGAIYMNASTVNFSGRAELEWSYNYAVSSGGALIANKQSFGDFRGAELKFAYNTAEYGGGAVYVAGGSTLIFSNNHLIFEGNRSIHGNGVLTWDSNSRVIFDDSMSNLDAIRNTAVNGGYIYVRDGYLEVDNIETRMINNTAEENGGAIYAERSTIVFTIPNLLYFELNTAMDSRALGFGGSIYSSYTYILFKGLDLFFTSNSAVAGAGIYGDWQTHILFDNKHIEFISNVGLLGSLGVNHNSFAEFSGNIDILKTSANWMSSGGFIYAQGASLITIDAKEVQILSNISTNAGGAFYIVDNSTVIFGGNTKMAVSSNTAKFGIGGAIYTSASYMEMNANEEMFRYNYSLSSGGAVYAAWGSTIVFNGDYVRFYDNTAEMGDGTIFWSKSLIEFTNRMQKLEAVNNTAVNGGFVYVYDGKFNLDTNAYFAVNTASSGSGGAFYLNQSTITFSANAGVDFEANIASVTGGAIFSTSSLIVFEFNSGVNFKDNTARSGGAIGAINSIVDFNTDMEFARNTAMKDNNGVGGRGGAIYLGGGGNIMMLRGRNMLFDSNISYSSGGAIYIGDDNNLLGFDKSAGIFTNNTASDAGGGVYLESRSTFSINESNMEFGYNLALNGGAINLQNDGWWSVERSFVDFNNNSASGLGGGALFMGTFARGQVSNSAMQFINNAASSGGAVHMTGQTWLGFSASTVIYDRNQFSNVGGGIFINNGSTMIYNNRSVVYFSSNIAASSGGAIYATGDSYIDFDVDLLEFRYNRSINGYGVVYEDAVSTVDFSKAKHIRAIGNDALVGGFLYIDGRIKNINGILEVIENTARSGGGGGMNIINASDVNLAGYSSYFISNTAVTSGSAIYLDNNSKMTLTSKEVKVNYNRTSNSGSGAGAIYVGASSIIFSGIYNGVNKLEALGNSHTEGGFMYILNGYANIDAGLLIHDNEAGVYGGSGKGGAFYVENGYLRLGQGWASETSEISGNKAFGKGGAVYVLNSTVSIEAEVMDVVFENNINQISGAISENDLYMDEHSYAILRVQQNNVNSNVRLKMLSGIIGTSTDSKIDKSGTGVLELGGFIRYGGLLSLKEGAIEINKERTTLVSFDKMNIDAGARYGTLLHSGIHQTWTGYADIKGILETGIDYIGGEGDLFMSEGAIDLDLNTSSLTFKAHNFTSRQGNDAKQGVMSITIVRAPVINGYFSNYIGDSIFESAPDNPLWSRYSIKYIKGGSDGYDRVNLEVESEFKFGGAIFDMTHNQNEIARSIENVKETNKLNPFLSSLAERIRAEYEDPAKSYKNYAEIKQIFDSMTGKFTINMITQAANSGKESLYTKVKEALREEDRQTILQSIWIEGGGLQIKRDGEIGYGEGYRLFGERLRAGFPLWRGDHDLGLFFGYSNFEIKEGPD
ncbi:MAG: hypothetical protein LBH29_00840, partial [Elusimicrobiota bacterium]|nr:hypothetical protein [Elusimicrobiota bacterium]